MAGEELEAENYHKRKCSRFGQACKHTPGVLQMRGQLRWGDLGNTQQEV